MKGCKQGDICHKWKLVITLRMAALELEILAAWQLTFTSVHLHISSCPRRLFQA